MFLANWLRALEPLPRRGTPARRDCRATTKNVAQPAAAAGVTHVGGVPSLHVSRTASSGRPCRAAKQTGSASASALFLSVRSWSAMPWNLMMMQNRASSHQRGVRGGASRGRNGGARALDPQMEPAITILRELWRDRVFVALFAILAIAFGFLMAYRPELPQKPRLPGRHGHRAHPRRHARLPGRPGGAEGPRPSRTREPAANLMAEGDEGKDRRRGRPRSRRLLTVAPSATEPRTAMRASCATRLRMS